MYFKTIQASSLKSCFEVLKEIINDVNIFFTKDGVNITALDTAKVALINMNLNAEKFEEYECKDDIRAGVNVSNFFKILKFITNTDILTVTIENSDFIKIKIENEVKKSSTTFQLKMLWINEDELQIPEIKPTCVTVMPSVDFQRICRDMSNIGTEIKIERKNNILNIECDGDFASQQTEIDTEQNDFEGNAGSVYPLKYINLFTKATGMCSNMRIQLTNPTETMPIVFVYDVANLGKIEFYLAAKSE